MYMLHQPVALGTDLDIQAPACANALIQNLPMSLSYHLSRNKDTHTPPKSFKLVQNAAAHLLHKNGCHEYIPTALCLLFLKILGRQLNSLAVVLFKYLD